MSTPFRRLVATPLFVVLALLQAWDSGVLGSTPLVMALVAAAIALPAGAFLATARAGIHAAALGIALALLAIARVVSPVSLGELMLVAVIGFLILLFGHRLPRREAA